ncbi:hypothetical protein AHAS_Ahas11G0213000 [Arachis hypogaea]
MAIRISLFERSMSTWFTKPVVVCCDLANYRVSSYFVLPRWSKNVQRKHTFIKSIHDEKRSDESHNLFRGLCSHFFNVAQDFVTCEEEAAMLHSSLDELRAKLFDYHANLGPRSVPTTQNSMVIQRDPAPGSSDVRGPSKKNDEAINPTTVMGSAVRANESQERARFLSLLNSFRHN